MITIHALFMKKNIYSDQISFYTRDFSMVIQENIPKSQITWDKKLIKNGGDYLSFLNEKYFKSIFTKIQVKHFKK